MKRAAVGGELSTVSQGPTAGRTTHFAELESKLRSTQPELENLSQPTVTLVKNDGQLFAIATIERNALMIGEQ